MTNSSGACCNRSAGGCAGCADAGTDRRMESDCGGHCHHHGDSARPDSQIKQTPVGKLSGFVGFLRAQGLSVGIGETEDALQALNLVGFEDRETVKAVLRTLFAGSKAEQAVPADLTSPEWTSATSSVTSSEISSEAEEEGLRMAP